MLADVAPTAFVPTTDVERAKNFYVCVLGLEFVEMSPFALVVRSGGTTVRVTPIESHRPAGYTVLGWTVPDIATHVEWLVSLGVTPLRFDAMDQDDQGVWQSPSGAKVAWFCDPDGNTLSLTEGASHQ